MASFPRISIHPSIRFGKPCVKGTRLTVGEVLLIGREKVITAFIEDAEYTMLVLVTPRER